MQEINVITFIFLDTNYVYNIVILTYLNMILYFTYTYTECKIKLIRQQIRNKNIEKNINGVRLLLKMKGKV